MSEQETLCVTVESLHKEFSAIVGVSWNLPPDIAREAHAFLFGVNFSSQYTAVDRRRCLIRIINAKFRIHRERVKFLIDTAAKFRLFFGPDQKTALAESFDASDEMAFQRWATTVALPTDARKLFNPFSEIETLRYLKEQLIDATVNRSDARKGIQQERRESILRSIFGSWVFCIAEPSAAFCYYTDVPPNDVEESYFQHLQNHYPHALHRGCGAYAAMITQRDLTEESPAKLRSKLFAEIKRAFDELSNYSYLLIYFQAPTEQAKIGKTWMLVHDAIVYAERMSSGKLSAGFFHPERISAATSTHIRSLDLSRADFSTYQSGFAFRDCIVVCDQPPSRSISEYAITGIILLLEKNVADEAPIPCPACRSLRVRGNSYPVLGVKSWECQNPLCPERSAFDRGNRFSLASILRSQATTQPDALIPEESLRAWKLDVVGPKSPGQIAKMFILHYSLPGDRVVFVNWSDSFANLSGRSAIARNFDRPAGEESDPLPAFLNGSFFYRYLHAPSTSPRLGWREVPSHLPWLTLYEGSCLEILAELPEASLDGAVTSPPYYNAREYSSWPNLYCYLYDMKVAAEGVFRVLKPGGYYLFNVFDYFDNDNIVAFSALGKRRLALGAHLCQIFRNCGFEVSGNIIWHKGEIEGNRNYNQGNRAPFYQLPLNTWEHILILRKPSGSSAQLSFPHVVFYRPVMKWFNGENRHGHTAPFPEEVPDLLCSRLAPGSRILDPFGGSLTTAQACRRRRQDCVAIELRPEYCALGLTKISEQPLQLDLLQ